MVAFISCYFVDTAYGRTVNVLYVSLPWEYSGLKEFMIILYGYMKKYRLLAPCVFPKPSNSKKIGLIFRNFESSNLQILNSGFFEYCDGNLLET